MALGNDHTTPRAVPITRPQSAGNGVAPENSGHRSFFMATATRHSPGIRPTPNQRHPIHLEGLMQHHKFADLKAVKI